MDPDATADLLHGLTVLERGWLSSNNVVLHDDEGDSDTRAGGAVLVDAGHTGHAAQTVALVRRALEGRGHGRLAAVVNTHLHSDHCGGNAALARAFGARIVIPPGQADAVASWDAAALGYLPTGQHCERFRHDALLRPGDELAVGRRRWQALAAPGHDPHALMLFDADRGVLISADALWANGFGIVFPELVGESGFDDVAAVLDAIERLPVRLVVPGHGAPIIDVGAALARARSRLDSWRAEPARHARHAAKVLIVYHAMEHGRSQALADWQTWCTATPLLREVHARLGGGGDDAAFADWCTGLLDELVHAGALARNADGAVTHTG